MTAPININWPPNYTDIFIARAKRLSLLNSNHDLIVGAKEYYRTRPIEFINDWCVTYDPRNVSSGLPTTLPFILFPRQIEFIYFLQDCINDQENGLVEKSRDMGATWECAAFSVWMWLFSDGVAVGFGSRKEQLVDKLGDPDSIFEKIRIIIDHLPRFFWPKDFDIRYNAGYMKVTNPETGATITGEAGDNIGRGGRKSIYFKDESAHYERPEKIEAALGDNTNVQIDISSVNGTANIFARRRKSGVVWSPGKQIPKGSTKVFIFDWRDHPNKTQEWYETRRAKAEREGLLHVFAQEVDRDYSAAVKGACIPPAWIKAAIDAHIVLGFTESEMDGMISSALDVGDSDDGDSNACATKKGIILTEVEEWHERDTGVTARKALARMHVNGSHRLDYDCIGVGSGVKAEVNRLMDEGQLKNLQIVKWDAGATCLDPDMHIIPDDPDTPINKDFFANLKAQGWWKLRQRFENTYKVVVQGIEIPFDELIVLPSALSNIHEIVEELSQPIVKYDKRGRILIDKKPSGSTSPNKADSIMMLYWPAVDNEIVMAWA